MVIVTGDGVMVLVRCRRVFSVRMSVMCIVLRVRGIAFPINFTALLAPLMICDYLFKISKFIV